MTVAQIMRTNIDNHRLTHSISAATKVASCTAMIPSLLYEVVDESGAKVGEIDGERLVFLAHSAGLLHLDDVVNAMEDGLVIIDHNGYICYENEAYTRIVGVPMRKTVGRSLYDIEPEALLLNVLKNGKPARHKRHRIASVDKYVSMEMQPILKNSVVVGAWSLFRDVTELNALGREVARITEVAEALTSQLEESLSNYQIIGRDPKMKTLISRTVTAAKTDATVLIRGENGVGKEGFSNLLHHASRRKHHPFIAVNCAAIPESLIESELFGYEDGSFTGARKGGKVGKFELAKGGTLFLDEIGDMPLVMQSKLLRVLQEGEIEKIGREDTIPVDVRIVAATNQPLEELIAKKLFRQDLYYRLNVVSLTIPPLRERKDDILLLTNHFLERYNQLYEKSITLSRTACELLLAYHWPGNVRELQNCIESAVIMCDCGEISGDGLPNAPRSSDEYAPLPETFGTLQEETRRLEQRILAAVLLQCHGDRGAAARQLGISRRTFYRKLL